MSRQRCLKTWLVLLSLLPACGRTGPLEPDAPTVTAVLPAEGATGVALNTSVSAAFSLEMDDASISPTTFTVKQGTTPVFGAVTYTAESRTATFTPTAVLGTSLVYTATITTGARSGGVALATNHAWNFTTAPTGPPRVLSTTPLDGAMVSVAKKPTATFNQAMDSSTINELTFTLMQAATPIAGTVALNGTNNTATFTPAAPLEPGLPYTATITTGAKDVGQTALVAEYVWNFTTGACSQAPVVLGSAGNFAVLAYSTVTNTGLLTTVTGDLGLYPGTSVTGAPTVNGTQHISDSTAMKGMADLATAYADAAGRTLCAVTKAGDIGGQILTPGLYKSIAGLTITSADLTLDAEGDNDAVFIFQIGSTLTIPAARQVILTNGAKAANIYWHIGSAASLEASVVFKGTILANTEVNLGDGVTLDEGRALSLTTAVNLYNNTVVKPAP